MKRASTEISPLGRYLLDLCYRERYSMREASLAAKKSEGTLSKIVRRGIKTRPHPDTLKALADVLKGDYAEMMRLAGYTEPRQDAQLKTVSPELRALFDGLAELESESPQAAERIVAAIKVLIDAAGAANRAEPLNNDAEIEQPVLPGIQTKERPHPLSDRRLARANHRRARQASYQ